MTDGHSWRVTGHGQVKKRSRRVRNTNVLGRKRMRDLAGCSGLDLLHMPKPTIVANTYREVLRIRVATLER